MNANNEYRFYDAITMTEQEYAMVANCLDWLITSYEICECELGPDYMAALEGMAEVVARFATGSWDDYDAEYPNNPYLYGDFIESPNGERTYYATGYTGVAGCYWDSYYN